MAAIPHVLRAVRDPVAGRDSRWRPPLTTCFARRGLHGRCPLVPSRRKPWCPLPLSGHRTGPSVSRATTGHSADDEVAINSAHCGRAVPARPARRGARGEDDARAHDGMSRRGRSTVRDTLDIDSTRFRYACGKAHADCLYPPPPTWRAKKRLRTICWRYRTRLRNPARHVHREHIPTPVEPFELIQHCRIVATARNRPRKVRRQSLNMAPSDVAVAPHPHRARVRPPTRLAPTKWATSASAPSSSAPRTRLRGVLRLPASASASRQACAATGRMCSAPIRVPRRTCFGSDRTARTARTDPATARQCAAPDVLYRLTAS